jgi:hypothetical protein
MWLKTCLRGVSPLSSGLMPANSRLYVWSYIWFPTSWRNVPLTSSEVNWVNSDAVFMVTFISTNFMETKLMANICIYPWCTRKKLFLGFDLRLILANLDIFFSTDRNGSSWDVIGGLNGSDKTIKTVRLDIGTNAPFKAPTLYRCCLSSNLCRAAMLNCDGQEPTVFPRLLFIIRKFIHKTNIQWCLSLAWPREADKHL